VKILRIFGLIALVGGLVLILKSDFWKISRIECRQNENPCSPELWTEITSLTFGKNIIFFPTEAVKKEIFREKPTLKAVKIKKKLPNKLIFELKEREGIVALGLEGEQGFYIVDSEGVLLAKTKNSSLPLILLSQPIGLDIGQKIEEEEILRAINFLTNLRLNLFEPKQARIISPFSLEVLLKGDVTLLFSLKKEAQIQLDSLQFIFSRSKIEGKTIRKIDLRFDKPVLTYE